MKTLIHPTVVINPEAELHPTVKIGAYAVIGAGVKIGAGTEIGPHVVIEGNTEIGERNRIFAGAAIGLEPQDLKYNGATTAVKIGDDNVIREYVTVNRATGAGETTEIGNGNLIMAYCHVAHNCTIEDKVVIANAVALAGHVHIESRATIGGVLGIHQFVRIGKLAMVGGMSRINRDIPPYMLIEGSPSRVYALNLLGLKRAKLTPEDISLLKKAFRTIYRSGLTINEALETIKFLPENEHLQHLSRFLKMSQTQGRRGLTPGKKSNNERKETHQEQDQT